MSRLIFARTLITLFASVLMATAAAQAQTTWYVDDDAPNDPGPGDPTVSDPLEDGSAAHPFDAIQEGIDAASNGDTVLVLDGTYTGNGNRDIDFRGKAITVQSESGPDNCTVDCQGSQTEPHIGFYFDSGEDPNSVLEAVTIINAYLDFDRRSAIDVWNSSPTITSNVFVNNGIEFGGNVSDAQILGNMFRDFYFEPFGQAIRISGTSTSTKVVTIRANVFQDFSGGDFFAIDVGGTGDASNTGIIEDNTFRRFSSHSPFSGAVEVSGTGNAVNQGLIVGNTFDDIAGYGVRMSGTGDPGATIYGYLWSNVFTACGSRDCPVIGIGGTGLVEIHSWIVDNLIATCSGNAIEISGISSSQQYGEFVNNTVVGNRIGIRKGGNVYSLQIANTILWDNGDDLSGVQLGEISYSDISDGDFVGQNGNISQDPQFCDPANGDYHVLGGSPCIDAADNTAVPADSADLDGDSDTAEPTPFDLDDRLRFADRVGTPDTGNGNPPIVDMGAYEYQCAGDLDGDGDIDLADLAQLLSNYGTPSGATYADGDIDQDGDVDLADLAALLAVYGTTCE